MLGSRSLPGAGLLILLAARLLAARLLVAGLLVAGPLIVGPLVAGERAAFVQPLAGGIVAGPTEFEFEVYPAEPAVERIDVYVEGVFIGSAEAPSWSFSWAPERALEDTLVMAAVFAGGQLVEKLSIRTSDMSFGDVINVVEVQLFPVVRDRRGRYVPDLSREDFVLFEEGREIEIKTFSSDPAVLTVALLIDVSTSMEPKLQLVQKASVGFLDALDAGDLVSIYAFNHGVRRVQAPTEDLEEAKAEVRGLRADGGTALYDAVVRVVSDLGAIPGRRVLVVFSDGRDERSLTTLNRVVDAAHRSEAVVYTIGVGEEQEDLDAREDLEAMAIATGGEAHVIDKLKALPSTFAAILTDVRAQYQLTFTPPQAASGVRKVEVRAKEKKYRVRCRTSYTAK